MNTLIYKTVNSVGINEIKKILVEHHKIWFGSDLNSKALTQAAYLYAVDVDNYLESSDGTCAKFEIHESQTLSGHTEIYLVSDAGLEISFISDDSDDDYEDECGEMDEGERFINEDRAYGLREKLI